MPSPVGHALGGIAAGWLVQSRPSSCDGAQRQLTRTLGFAGLGMAADLDLLVGLHRGPTHSLAAALLVSLLAWVILRRPPHGDRLVLAAGAAYA